MISLTETAAKKIGQLRSEEGASPESMLRVFVKKGGCSGFSYELKFDDTSQDGDKVFENHNEKVVVDGQSLLYLIGMTLDYEGGLNGQGFVFSNPNATKTCGCGSSFGV
ncbi:MAG: iron-sulfur cluster insertion protein ErpA [Bdellovibrionaceae bacterium]|nr:iron-sulfur cluster insertion protein ErpA [Bdellovibrionales bacterium]MCB9084361.1 iron-sulfur cluster insertion protein ErpA [Pseudobdellovibrionaceae bacterium]